MAKVTVPQTLIRHRQQFASFSSSKPGKWSKWHIVYRITGPHAFGDRQYASHDTICGHFYGWPDEVDGVALTETCTLDQVRAEDLCGRCVHGLYVEDE